MLDAVLFVAFPYVAVALAIGGGIYRYYNDRFSYSSFSSQFLENRRLFWGSVPWHYAILIVLLAHVLAAAFSGVWAALIGHPIRLYVLEVTGLVLALVALVGLGLLILRRLRNPRIFVVTSVMDWVLLAALLAQVALGFWVALFYRWGADWFLYTAAPWLWSLVSLSPRIEHVVSLPLVVRLHMLGGFLIVALFPFTRLVHLVAFPVTYLWRPYQVVIWNHRPTPQARQLPGRGAYPVDRVGTPVGPSGGRSVAIAAEGGREPVSSVGDGQKSRPATRQASVPDRPSDENAG